MEITEQEDLLALADALECAIQKTDAQLKNKGAKPYERALQAQKARYESLLELVRGAAPK